MKPQLQDFVCVDLPEQVRNWVPNDPEDVYYYMELTIGEDTRPGGDLFGLTVSTPKALLKRMRTLGPPSISGRHHLILLDYSWDKVLQFINDVIDQCQGNDWEDISTRLARHFSWEFEDYIADADIVN
jgi:hypothetical protein